MKKIAFCTLLSILFSFSSCSLFEMDNYDEPAETIKGEVIDKKTGNPVLTDQGSEGIRVRLTELSWGDNVSPNPDFYCMSDGTFQNTKVFKGHYNIRLDGPFIPLLREDGRGVVYADETLDMDIKGTTNVKIEVEPFLNVELIENPTVGNGKITAKVRVSRGVDNDIFKAKVGQMGNYDDKFLNITDIQLFVSQSSSVGYRARDERWSNEILYSGSEFNAFLDQEVIIESKGSIPAGRTVFIRAAARINYDTPTGSGTRRWNYSKAMEIMIP